MVGGTKVYLLIMNMSNECRSVEASSFLDGVFLLLVAALQQFYCSINMQPVTVLGQF